MKYVWIEESPNTAYRGLPKTRAGLEVERKSPERLFRGPAETKKPKKMHFQGLNDTSKDGGWLDGVRRGWRWKRVAGKCPTRPHTPAREIQAAGEEMRVAGVWLGFFLQCFEKS